MGGNGAERPSTCGTALGIADRVREDHDAPTRPGVTTRPTADAWAYVEDWLDAPAAWIPAPGPGHRELLGRLIRELDLRSNLIPDAVLAALCIEHGVSIVSTDTDFARFRELTWVNPLTD